MIKGNYKNLSSPGDSYFFTIHTRFSSIHTKAAAGDATGDGAEIKKFVNCITAY